MHILLYEPPPTTVKLEDLRVSASLTSKSLDITIYTSTESITTRLGSLTLIKKKKHELDVIRWTHVSCTHVSTLSTRLRNSEALVKSQRAQIADLEAQLENILLSKREAEDADYAKYAALINTKKLKIRDQQKLLATAKVDPTVAAKVRALRDAVPKSTGSNPRIDTWDGRNAAKLKGRADSPPSPSIVIKDEPIISDESTQEEDLESEREEARQLTPTPDESDAGDMEMAHAPLPTRSTAMHMETTNSNPPSEMEDVDMQEPAVVSAEGGTSNGMDDGKGLAGTKITTEDATARDGHGGGDDDDDDEDDDEL